ncbi:hypothetical protein AZI87_16990 [Bdellovibrio bacteriovorus]|uniref:Lipoprotein n=1 Tax=Bdellovibrio bacteriovorus TaxID=959 RepID=A0A161PQQ2_BDEBC|nr:hypothetical protein [Bdellovibrio bacteriovorus]KYG62956.1 hypothetical protein AZI87_16990 [Bdellovibrio bacteriovorus]
MMKCGTFSVIAVSLLTAFLVGCNAPESDDSGSTAPDLSVSWLSGKAFETACLAGNDPVTGADHYQAQIEFDGTDFNYTELWYTGTCTGANYTVVYLTGGTVAISGSGTTRNIDFQLDDLFIMPMVTAAQTAYNSDCGGSSPWAGNAANGNNGVAESAFMMTCMNKDFPSLANKTVSNIISLSGTSLTVGLGDSGMPGVLSGGTVPASATVQLVLQ